MNAGGDAVEGGGVREYAGGDQIASPCAAVSKLRLFDLTARSPSPSPNTFRRRGGDHVMALEGGDAWAPAKPRPDERLIRAVVRAHRWRRLIENGTYRSAVEIAEAEKITPSFVNRLLRLTLLAPEIQEAIIEGRQPKSIQLGELTRAMSSGWEEHIRRFSTGLRPSN